ncbi:MAG: NAD-dependent epimerase/dehydratase family protein [Oceanococcus sp.]
MDSDDVLPQLRGKLVVTLPPSAQGACDLRLRRLLPHLDKVDTLVYISTSGVYGDCAGEWVNESRALAPITERAIRRVDAEQQLQVWAEQHKARLVILRVPGIYGPGRLPIKRLQEGRPVMHPEQAPFSNRIHADDLANSICLALERGRGVYNISDGEPDSMSRYFLLCAEHLGLPAPPLIDRASAEKTFSPALMSFYRESRRLDICKARAELGFSPRYPNLSAGLPAC